MSKRSPKSIDYSTHHENNGKSLLNLLLVHCFLDREWFIFVKYPLLQ